MLRKLSTFTAAIAAFAALACAKAPQTAQDSVKSARLARLMEKYPRQIQVYPQKQMVRLGIGDPFFETYAFSSKAIHTDYTGADDPTGKGFPENRRYRYSPHISGEYFYRVLPWLLVGGIADFQITCWQKEYYNNENVLVGHSDENFFNLCILPSVRFHYFRRANCELYSAISLGLDINGGTETDLRGRNTVCAFASQFTLLGVIAGKDRWWGFAELGGLWSMRGAQYIYMLNSELIKCGVAYRF